MFSCKKKQEDIKISGSFTFDGTSYSISSCRVDHVGYPERVPGDTLSQDSTRFILHTAFYGYQGDIHLFLIAPDNDLMPGQTYETLYEDSLSYIVIRSSEGDTTRPVRVTSASVTLLAMEDPVAAGKNWLSYYFTLTVDGNPSPLTIDGSFIGPHTVNYTVDQPSYGFITFDTIATGLARPSLYRWNHLFCDDSNYFELKFYSNRARFADKGTINVGVQFVVGFHSYQENFPAAGTYPVSIEAKEATLYFGHRDGSVNWGTYWQTFYAGSIVGKANILSDTLYLHRCTSDSITLTFALKDQLGNTVQGSYSGRYY